MFSAAHSRHAALKLLPAFLVICLIALTFPVAAAAAPAAPVSDPLVRKTASGYVRGKTTTGIETANKAWAWLGIPFAKPPVGELRWKAPHDPAPWTGVRQATKFGSPCAQTGSFVLNLDYETYDKTVGSEDCLYLNVWRPRTAATNLPVLFWIHGGANYSGESASSFYDGTNFAAQNNMVFVSCNYRLGQFGWFAAPALRTGDPLDDSGNYGTLDIIKALKWVQYNITAFGGDPGNVTIMGQSAGGWNVFSLLSSPLAIGLFQKAFAMSGAPLSFPIAAGEQQANAVIRKCLVKDGYATDDASADQFMKSRGNGWVASYMRSRPPDEIVSSAPEGAGNPLNMVSILEDGYVIPGSVLGSIDGGNYTKVPTILSSTRDEMKMFLPFMIGTMNQQEFAKMIKEADITTPTWASGDTGIPLQELLNPLWWPFYDLVAQSLSAATMKMFGVVVPGFLMSLRQPNVYTYEFDWDEEPKPLDFLLGAAHAVDIPFVFHNFDRGDNQLTRVLWCAKTRPSCEALSAAMMRYVAQFARTGDPNGGGLPSWQPWTSGDAHTMVFDTPFGMKAGAPRY